MLKPTASNPELKPSERQAVQLQAFEHILNHTQCTADSYYLVETHEGRPSSVGHILLLLVSVLSAAL
jgi:hypothetical protein